MWISLGIWLSRLRWSEERQDKDSSFSEEKEAKRLLFCGGSRPRRRRNPAGSASLEAIVKSLFASFSSGKEDSFS
jgi:hypothetical protein